MTEQDKIFLNYMENECDKVELDHIHKHLVSKLNGVTYENCIIEYTFTNNIYRYIHHNANRPYLAADHAVIEEIIKAFPAWDRKRKIKMIK